MSRARIDIPKERIAEFCRRDHIRRLALFGSVLRDDFRPDSDVDVLVEFEPEAHVGLTGLAGTEIKWARTHRHGFAEFHGRRSAECGIVLSAVMTPLI